MLPAQDLLTLKKSTQSFFLPVLTFLQWLWADKARRRRLMLVSGTTGGVSLALGLVTAGMCQTPWEVVQLVVHVTMIVCRTLVRYFARGCKPLYPHWTLRFEVIRAIMRGCMDKHGGRVVLLHHAQWIRRQTSWFGTFLGWFTCRHHQTRIEPVKVNRLEHLWLKDMKKPEETQTNTPPSTRLVVLYFHGGGYAVLSPRLYISFCNSLASAIKRHLSTQCGIKNAHVDFFLANYRKTPEHSFPVPAEDALAMYDYLINEEKVPPQHIIVAGDSAGGGLTMSVLLRIRDQKLLPPPVAAIVSCPSVDLSGDEVEREHCLLTSEMIQACRAVYHKTIEDKTTWLDASPVHCDLTNLPPVFIQAASLDFLFNHSLRLMKKAEDDGVKDWELDIHEGMPHVFTNFPHIVLPYASVGIERMAAFAAKKFCKVLTNQSSTSVLPSAA